jgi:protocatechuate 3,4-dioxygenase beta subunit
MLTNFSRIALGAVAALLVVICVLPLRAQDQSSAANSAANPTADSTEDKKQLASVAGKVVRQGTDEPLRKARVVLFLEGHKGENDLDAVTGADGKFVFDSVAPGAYELQVNHDGYVTKSYGEEGHDDAILTLAAGQKLEDLIFRLQKCAVITGRVVDEDGDPVFGINVEVGQNKKHRGKWKPQLGGEAETNDLGEYRVFNLQPGKYLICAAPPIVPEAVARAEASAASPKPQSPSSYVTTCYPGTQNMDRASEIDVKSGDEISGMDITLVRNRTYRIRGTITDLSGNSDAGDYAVAVRSVERLGNRISSSFARIDPKDRSFELSGLAPGIYEVMGIKFDAEADRGIARVEIIDADIDSVKIVMSLGTELRGQVAMDGKTALPPTLRVWLVGKPKGQSFGGMARPKPDGTFNLINVHDGSYAISVESECKDCYLKSARLNGVDLLERGLQVSGPVSQPVELVYSSRGGTVDGTVVKDDGLPAVGATVVLLPDASRREWADMHERGVTDQYGRFTIRGVAPGTYGAFAFNRSEDADEIEDPEFLNPIESQGKSVEIEENGKQTVQLKLTVTNAESPADRK